MATASSLSPAPPPPPPPGPAAEVEVRRRSKRRRYTAVACDECRRRKVKCLPGGSNGRCQRCADRGRDECGFQEANVRSEHDGESDDGTSASVMALRDDVKMLRSTLAGWMAASASTPASGLASGPLPALRTPLTSASLMAPAPDPGFGPHDALRRGSGPAASVPGPTTPGPDLDSTGRASGAHEEPRFVGPTRSAYSFQAGGQALSRLGIAALDTAQGSGQQTPSDSPAPRSPAAPPGLEAEPQTAASFWARCTPAELAHWIAVFREEVELVYPCIVSDEWVRNADDIIQLARAMSPVSPKDVHLAALAVATAMMLEGQGDNGQAGNKGLGSTATALIGPVERHVLNILEPSRELKDLQLLILLSIYYFHTDQDLLAWRTIGLAAREALVMGLHRRSTLFDTFRDPLDRAMAVRVFWTIYVLDRRWSFGAGLSFALVDRDIDPDLPEPKAFPDNGGQGQGAAYLQCMVGYGRLSSTLWDALHPGLQQQQQQQPKPSRDWAESTTLNLDMRAQEWLESIPSELRLRHPRLGLAAIAQPAVLHRLRALLYLRGNHIRVLIYRYYLLSPSRIRLSHRNAWLAVDIARDSIAVLVHLDESSGIYRRQQAAFNYFLVSALAVLFLAVCNEPETFAGACKAEIVRAVGLLRGLSKSSYGSRRLWRSVRGVIPLLRKLEARRADGAGNGNGDGGGSTSTRELSSESQQQQRQQQQQQQSRKDGPQYDGSGSVPGGTVQDGTRESTADGAPGRNGGLSSMINDDATFLQQQQQQQQQAVDYDSSALSIGTTPDFGVMGNELMDLFEMFENGQAFYNTTVTPLQHQHQQGGQIVTAAPTHLDAMSWLGDGVGEVPEYISAEQGAISSQFNLLI